MPTPNKIRFIVACNLLAWSAAAWAQSDTRDSVAAALRENEARWNQEYAVKDLSKIAAHYADDAVLISPGMPPASGRESIHKILSEMMADPALSLKFQTARVEVAASGDLAWTQGSYMLTMTNPQSKQVIHDHGSYVTTYRREQDGSWKAVADIASSEMSPAPSTMAGGDMNK